MIFPGDTPPVPTITTPLSTLTWKVGDTINFSGSATDSQDGQLPASALSWVVLIHHCPSNCHLHTYQTFTGVASGSFPAPDHEYPSFLEIQLTATDSLGLTATTSVNIQPQVVNLTFQTVSVPPGLPAQHLRRNVRGRDALRPYGDPRLRQHDQRTVAAER